MGSSYGWLVGNTEDDCLPIQIAQNVFKSKIEARPVNAGHYMASNIAFHLQLIRLQTLVAIDAESRLTSIPSFCAPPSEVAALFNSNLSRRPFLREVSI